jgi:hypothetical protein
MQTDKKEEKKLNSIQCMQKRNLTITLSLRSIEILTLRLGEYKI